MSHTMSLLTLSLKHGQTQDEARNRLEIAVNEVKKLFGSLIQNVVWSIDRNPVRIDGAGFWIEMVVDAESVHATGDIPMLGRPSRQAAHRPASKRIMRQTFHKQLQ